jgi:hypothetical protein
MKNSNDTFGNRTRNLPACGEVRHRIPYVPVYISLKYLTSVRCVNVSDPVISDGDVFRRQIITDFVRLGVILGL